MVHEPGGRGKIEGRTQEEERCEEVMGEGKLSIIEQTNEGQTETGDESSYKKKVVCAIGDYSIET